MECKVTDRLPEVEFGYEAKQRSDIQGALKLNA